MCVWSTKGEKQFALDKKENKSQIIIIYSDSLLMLIVNRTTHVVVFRMCIYIYIYVSLHHKHDFSGKTKAFTCSLSLFLYSVSSAHLSLFPFRNFASTSPVFHGIITELCVEAFKIQTHHMNQKRKTMEHVRDTQTHTHTGIIIME